MAIIVFLLKNSVILAALVLALLPSSPFQMISNSAIAEYLGTLNWFVPVSAIVAELEAWLVCVAVYYAYQVILRWAKVIE